MLHIYSNQEVQEVTGKTEAPIPHGVKDEGEETGTPSPIRGAVSVSCLPLLMLHSRTAHATAILEHVCYGVGDAGREDKSCSCPHVVKKNL